MDSDWFFLIGIDPGLVDTGVISWRIDTTRQVCMLSHRVVTRGTGAEVLAALKDMNIDFSSLRTTPSKKHIFIEGYRPRQHMTTDARMVLLVRDIHDALPGSKVLDNTGIKKRIKPALLDLLMAHRLPSSNHNDLLSAARIALLGAFKDPELNAVIADMVRDYIDGLHNWNYSIG